jgi:hypothetical protein
MPTVTNLQLVRRIGAAEECRRLRRGVAGFDALAQVNDIHLGPIPAGVGSFHPPGSLVALGRLKPQCNVYASAVRYLPLAWHGVGRNFPRGAHSPLTIVGANWSR